MFYFATGVEIVSEVCILGDGIGATKDVQFKHDCVIRLVRLTFHDIVNVDKNVRSTILPENAVSQDHHAVVVGNYQSAIGTKPC